MKNLTIEQKEQSLKDNFNFYVGGLTDEGIEYYYNKMINETKLIAGEWYYWNEKLQQWKPETYKFNETCK